MATNARTSRRSYFSSPIACAWVLFLATVLAACDGNTAIVAVGPTPSAATTDASVTASISPSPAPSAPFVGYGVAVGAACAGFSTPSFNVGIFAFRPVDLDTVTISMIDGTHLGGPSVTFPSATITSAFGSVRIAGNTTRTFNFHPQFGCSRTVPRFVSADIGLIDLGGTRRMVTVRGPWATAQ